MLKCGEDYLFYDLVSKCAVAGNVPLYLLTLDQAEKETEPRVSIEYEQAALIKSFFNTRA